MLVLVITPGGHPVAGIADGSAIFVNFYGVRNGFWPAAVAVEVNKGADAPTI